MTDTVPPVSPPPPPPGKVLAVDPGERRIGFAITDPERKFAFPLTQLERTTPERDAVRLKELVREERVVLLVVGVGVLSAAASSCITPLLLLLEQLLLQHGPG